jgi:hypothetical protein
VKRGSESRSGHGIDVEAFGSSRPGKRAHLGIGIRSLTGVLRGKVTFAYDLAGQKTSVVNPRGDTMAFT